VKVLKDLSKEYIYQLLEAVKDPEIPVLSLKDLGVVRDVIVKRSSVQVIITPTYSGCPAMKTMEDDIVNHLNSNGIEKVKVITTLSPAWTTDWMTEEGKKKLRDYGIAPPEEATEDKSALFAEPQKVECPKCGSRNTKLISQFGSTACKALYKCDDCEEPFDYFKCLK